MHVTSVEIVGRASFGGADFGEGEQSETGNREDAAGSSEQGSPDEAERSGDSG